MRIKFSTALAGVFLANLASAHPGHGPNNLAAQVSQPLAGVDHFVAFVAVTAALLLGLKLMLKARDRRNSKSV